MHRHELFQTNQTELNSDKKRGRKHISCELWTEENQWHLQAHEPRSEGRVS